MKHKSSYHLSCIVPVYNVEEYLDACVESLLRIPSIQVEIILVDDGSTDSSAKLVDRYAAHYPFVKAIHQVNQGPGIARNSGLEVAGGEYVAFVDSDDWIEPERLVALYRQAKQDALDMILGYVRYVVPDDPDYEYAPFLPVPDSVKGGVYAGGCCFAEFIRNGKFVPMATSYLYRREWLEQEKLRFEPVLHEDELWSVKALCLARRVVCTDREFYYYRQRSGSIMKTLDTGRRINSLVHIANRILQFAGRFSAEERRQVRSMLYVKAAELYKLAFRLLDKKRDSRFRLESHSLYQLYHDRNRLTPEARSICMSLYSVGRKKLRNYHAWLVSPEVDGMPALVPDDKVVLLFYSRIWDAPLVYPREQVPEGMLITSDRKYLARADAVVFHLPTLEFDLEGDLEKSPGQRWVGWTLECEENYPFIKSTEFMSLFDYWMSYHQGADVVHPYYEAGYPGRLQQTVPRPFEQKRGICMLVSSPFNRSGRQEYLKELMEMVRIDSYGKLYNNSRLEEDNGLSSKMALYEGYKFVIAFENSCAKDYVTEKFFDPLLAGAVPVYLGAPNVDEFAPGDNCYVDVRKHETVEELAAYLQACLDDPALYEQYQAWRKHPLRPSFIQKAAAQQIHPYIRLCRLIQAGQQHPQISRKRPDGRLVLCSFGDSRYEASRERLQEQAEDFDLFDAIHLYNEFDLPASFREDFKDQLQADVRGFGYWVWKPQVILDTLSKMDDGDVLLYVDMGCHLNSRGREKLLEYWQEVKQNDSGFLVSPMEAIRKECYWTKGDLLDYFQVRGTETASSPQYQAGVIFVRKEAGTIGLIQRWLKLYYECFHLLDDSPSRSPDEAGFVEHRHDQSALSLLLKRHGASEIPLEEVYRPGWDLCKRFYPILVERDLC
ncbi:glycosyltransferase family 10 [Parabacteroides sp. W1-Q-101]|uniref:glycosyltransferase family 10 domain-containing protein n=2 Tax=Parabacteroides TaxID=375288 RepID=UPI00202DEE86|nr:glycosyltransferase family 10 [Parabacteroides sp. W1-Q-101]MCM0718135.1 glycosyltransferase family 10 [Parabacteroides sp. W1-Q-101]